ncbi:MAG TPA: hypothetical protein VIM25_11945 [Candidatus Limnocylindrales bacterium]
MRGALLVALAAVALAGCGLAGLFGPSGGPYPEACDQLDFVSRQCASMVTRAESQAGLGAADVSAIDILPPPNGGVGGIGGYMISRVRLHLATGTERTEEIWCIGIGREGDPVCHPDASIAFYGGVDGDVPCTGEPPEGCATPAPTARPAVRAQAVPLRLATLDIPIDHVGHYEVEVGKAGLPDGVLTERSATLADPKPQSFWIEERIAIDVRPVDSTRPPVGSVFRDRFDGVEPVTVFLVFDVTDISPGGVLQVRDLVVG